MINQGNSSEALIERFEALYEATHRQLFAFIRANCRQPSAVEDIAQECYIRIWKQLAELKDDAKLLSLLRTYAKGLIIDHIRKNAADKLREVNYSSKHDSLAYADTAVIDKELITQYRDAVNAMPPQRKRVFIMVRELGLSHQQVAEILNISVHTIERHMNDAMHNLKARFSTASNLF